MESPKMIYLKSLDGDVFEVEEKVAVQSQTLNNMIQDNCAAGVIPISNVSSRILAKVIEYCKKHVNCNASDELELKLWDDMFVKVDQNTLFDIIMAANYLDIKNLLDLTCKVVADMIKGKTPEEVRNTFNIKNDFSPEEQEEIRKENQWAFE